VVQSQDLLSLCAVAVVCCVFQGWRPQPTANAIAHLKVDPCLPSLCRNVLSCLFSGLRSSHRAAMLQHICRRWLTRLPLCAVGCGCVCCCCSSLSLLCCASLHVCVFVHHLQRLVLLVAVTAAEAVACGCSLLCPLACGPGDFTLPPVWPSMPVYMYIVVLL